ncbi:MAG: hypothetical protein A4E70_02271 [Syntrophus sp. PtaU1.Bin005]|jgi:hypothetical protein|uniref:hypothetical protein n=1 Tax=Syntrophus sp. (in: bacteria) TaxID=48412 RepID=UPI0009CAAFF5|nr:MAG: hypothetical protein A4E69_03222 [Syntrophus sp. PtaB.Bin138]OPY78944.1 MAG: hypothetical protein A4E70_02271 [Syntrophus sp. PtaU1.Bin005]
MAEMKRSSYTHKKPRTRSSRLFGFNNSILSNRTVYLNPCVESGDSLSMEEVVLFASAGKYFSNKNS